MTAHRAPRCFKLIGEEREGGYIYLRSDDLPGFTFMLEPGEARSVGAAIKALHPAITAYFRAKFPKQPRRATEFSYADLRSDKKQLIVADPCFA